MLRITVASNFIRRLVGLMGRSSLPREEGLLITNCRRTHTAFMRFPIDVVWLNAERKIIAVEENLAPWRMSVSVSGAASCLELAAGGAARHGLTVGGRLPGESGNW